MDYKSREKEQKESLELFNAFATLQLFNALPFEIMDNIGLRERVIYFLFFDNAAFVCLNECANEADIIDYVLKDFFGPDGPGAFAKVTYNDYVIAYGLMQNKNPSALYICSKSDSALSAFARGEEGLNAEFLTQLLESPTVLSSL